MAAITTWRDIPVLESILRIDRHHRVATPETIANEAVLHVGDVYDSVAALIAGGILEIVASPDDASSDTIIVKLSAPFDALTRFGVMGTSRRSSTATH